MKQKSKTKNRKSNRKARPALASPTLEKWLSKLAHMEMSSKFDDIVAALKEDHKMLRNLGKVLKSNDSSGPEKKEAYENFSSLLKSHAKSEEKAVYDRCVSIKGLTQEADEGYVEHQIADTLMKNIALTRNKYKWNALVKVLAEVVEHHADEEENEMLPHLEKLFEKNERATMSHKFIALREKSQTNVTDKNAGILTQVHSAQQASGAQLIQEAVL